MKLSPKEKAEELVYKFIDTRISWKQSKLCALIAVDEIIEALPCREEYGGEWKLIDNTEYWQEVKQELEKLKK